MIRIYAIAATFCFLLGQVPQDCSAAVTYQIVDKATGSQEGPNGGDVFAMDGTITFASVCGTDCVTSDVLGYEITWSSTGGSSGTIVGPGSGAFGEIVANPDKVLDVRADGIYFDYAADVDNDNEFILYGGGLLGLPTLGWRNAGGSKENNLATVTSFGMPPVIWEWNNDSSGRGTTNTITTGDVKIFTAVPEPSAFLALGLIGVVLGGRNYFGARRRFRIW